MRLYECRKWRGGISTRCKRSGVTDVPRVPSGYPTYDPAAYQQHAAVYGNYMAANPYMAGTTGQQEAPRGYSPPTSASGMSSYLNGASYGAMYPNR